MKVTFSLEMVMFSLKNVKFLIPSPYYNFCMVQCIGAMRDLDTRCNAPASPMVTTLLSTSLCFRNTGDPPTTHISIFTQNIKIKKEKKRNKKKYQDKKREKKEKKKYQDAGDLPVLRVTASFTCSTTSINNKKFGK